jgi:hypothetical protein
LAVLSKVRLAVDGVAVVEAVRQKLQAREGGPSTSGTEALTRQK